MVNDSSKLKEALTKFPGKWYISLKDRCASAKDHSVKLQPWMEPDTNRASVGSLDDAINGLLETKPSAPVSRLAFSTADPLPPVVMFCFDAIVNSYGQGSGVTAVVKRFNGELPDSSEVSWMDERLQQLLLKAYRQAVKLALDQAIMLDYELSDYDELLQDLSDFCDNWHLGSETEGAWGQAVRAGKPSLFSLSIDKEDNSPRSHLLNMGDICVRIGQLNEAGVRALWAALHLELMYMSNDDDERYSIQAHPVLLRNLTIQASDPPLGYPIFASKFVSLPFRVVHHS